MKSNSFGSAFRTAAVFALGTVLASNSADAASPAKLAGSLVGLVRDRAGIPQMGAVVEIYNRNDKRISKAITNAGGEFGFDDLLPDLYSLRINMPSFMPALKRNITVQPGVRSVLAINLASMLSSVEIVYSTPTSGSLMSDDWKWVLRSSMSTRPALRIFDDPMRSQTESSAKVFSDTTGLLSLSSGDSTPFTSGNQSDLGTSFALATSLFGSNKVQVSGKFGYGMESDLNSTAIRTSFSRADAGGPEVKLMVQQVALPTRSFGLLGGQLGNAPAMRTMSITVLERFEIGDGISMDYGASLDSVTFLDRLNYLSPFARITYKAGGHGSFVVAYSSGAPPVDLLTRGDNSSGDALQKDLAALTVLPRVSLRDGGVNVQRVQNVEASYNVDLGSRSLSFGYFHEAIANGALTLSAPGDFYMMDLLPDLSSNSSVFNIGNYQRSGYTASATQLFGDDYSLTLSVGRSGVLTADESALETGEPQELRSKIRSGQRHWMRGRIAGVTPVTRTKFVASYEWTDHTSLTPGHVYLTQRLNPETGLNFRFRQPLPGFFGLPGRVEAYTDFRNMLAQGYLPITLSDGRRLLLAHTPRSVRGGVSFIF